MKKIINILLILVLLMGIGAGTYFMVNKYNKPSVPEEPSTKTEQKEAAATSLSSNVYNTSALATADAERPFIQKVVLKVPKSLLLREIGFKGSLDVQNNGDLDSLIDFKLTLGEASLTITYFNKIREDVYYRKDSFELNNSTTQEGDFHVYTIDLYNLIIFGSSFAMHYGADSPGFNYFGMSGNFEGDSLMVESSKFSHYAIDINGDDVSNNVLKSFVRGVSLLDPPTKEGYTFTGWYIDEACTQLYTGTTVTSDIVLYAGWQINTYTVTFNSKGGSEVGKKTVDWNTVVDTVNPVREGYNFIGWYLPNGEKYTNQPIKSDTTLEAQWERIVCKVTFMVDGKVYKELNVNYGTSLVVAANSAALATSNITSYSFTDDSLEVNSSLGEMKVLDDMLVNVTLPTETEKALAKLQSNWVSIVGGVLGLLIGVCLIAGISKGIKASRG